MRWATIAPPTPRPSAADRGDDLAQLVQPTVGREHAKEIGGQRVDLQGRGERYHRAVGIVPLDQRTADEAREIGRFGERAAMRFEAPRHRVDLLVVTRQPEQRRGVAARQALLVRHARKLAGGMIHAL